MRTPRAHLQLPQTTPRKPQEPWRTFFSAENGLKMAKNDQTPCKYAFSEIFRAIFSAEKVRGGCARPVPTCNYLKPPPESLRNPSALFFRPKTDSKWPKTTKNRQIRLSLRCFALFLARKKCAEGAHAPCPLATTSNNHIYKNNILYIYIFLYWIPKMHKKTL